MDSGRWNSAVRGTPVRSGKALERSGHGEIGEGETDTEKHWKTHMGPIGIVGKRIYSATEFFSSMLEFTLLVRYY